MNEQRQILLQDGMPTDGRGNLVPIVFVSPECPEVVTPYLFWVGECPFCGSWIKHAGEPCHSDGWLGLVQASCGVESCPCRKLGHYYMKVSRRVWAKIRDRYQPVKN
jgi:hypothetical protein